MWGNREGSSSENSPSAGLESLRERYRKPESIFCLVRASRRTIVIFDGTLAFIKNNKIMVDSGTPKHVAGKAALLSDV